MFKRGYLAGGATGTSTAYVMEAVRGAFPLHHCGLPTLAGPH